MYFFYNSHLTNFFKKPEINRNVQERRKKEKHVLHDLCLERECFILPVEMLSFQVAVQLSQAQPLSLPLSGEG